jgi:hypothetical protein
LNSKHSGIPEDSKSPTLGLGVSSSHFTQNGVATMMMMIMRMKKTSQNKGDSGDFTTIRKLGL